MWIKLYKTWACSNIWLHMDVIVKMYYSVLLKYFNARKCAQMHFNDKICSYWEIVPRNQLQLGFKNIWYNPGPPLFRFLFWIMKIIEKTRKFFSGSAPEPIWFLEASQTDDGTQNFYIGNSVITAPYFESRNQSTKVKWQRCK